MKILAIDPGLTIGYATYEDDKNLSFGQSQDPDYILDWIEEQSVLGSVLLVENYISAGHLTKEAMHTIKLVGLFEGFGTWISKTNDITVRLVFPQARLSSVARATTLVGNYRTTLHRDGRDAIAALAHAISYARRNS